ncbi:MAG: hypothetical protein HFG72_01760 [Hungatella sp.]|jgi:peptidoglycan hydrolase CwlO-like protein|nr:hypothetical protein [Hungatella sp.]
MSDQEMLNALKALLKPIQNKLDSLDIKLSEQQIQIDSLRLDMKTSERAIRKDIHQLNDGIDTLVEVMEIKGILPEAK